MAARKVLLIGWDSADWNVASPLIDQGQLPHLERLVSRGVMGNLASLEPAVEPALWTSLATGRNAVDHGVLSFAEVSADGAAARPVTAASRRLPAIWNMLSASGIAAHVVGWPATQGDLVELGSVVSDWFPVPTAAPGERWPPTPAGAIWPAGLVTALHELRVSPAEVDADMVRLFVPRAPEVNQDADVRLQRLRVYLAAAFSIQAAATWLLEHQPWEFMAVRFAALGAICREFMPFHPPKMAQTPDRHFRVYSDVVASAYRLHDLMLGRLAALAGESTTIVLASQHGYRCDHLRPGAEPAAIDDVGAWTRPQGLFAAAGPLIRQDELVHGAGLLDVVPTLLSMFGLSAPAAMPGRTLEQIFLDLPDAETEPAGLVDSESRGIAALCFDAEAAASATRHCSAVDYVGPYAELDPDHPQAIAMELTWSRARYLAAAGDWHEALPHLQELYREWPERVEFGQLLYECELELGLGTARETLEATLQYIEKADVKLLARATFAYRMGSFAESLDLLTQAKSAGASGLQLQRQLALTLMALRRWSEAEQVCRRVITADPQQALAYVGLAESLLRQRKLQGAADAAAEARGLNFELAPAHFILGVARGRLGDIDSAVQSMSVAVRIAPQVPLYHRMLANLYRRAGDSQRAANHMAVSHRLIAQRKLGANPSSHL